MQLTLQQVFNTAWKMASEDRRCPTNRLFHVTADGVVGCYIGQSIIDNGLYDAYNAYAEKPYYLSKEDDFWGQQDKNISHGALNTIVDIHDSRLPANITLDRLLKFAEKYNLSIPVDLPELKTYAIMEESHA